MFGLPPLRPKFDPMRNPIHVLAVTLFISSAVSCSGEKEDSIIPEPEGAAFFPIDTGLTRIYAVDSIYWDDFTGTHDTLSYLIKEKIADTFKDLQGRPCLRLERYIQKQGNGWIIDRVWSATRTRTTAEQTEDNIRYLKLVFPLRDETNWNGNVYNTLPPENYRIIKMGSDTGAGTSFPRTATILHGDSVGNRITLQYGLEKYAEGPGLIYKKKVSLTFNFPLTTIRSGYIYTETLTDYEPR